MNATPDTRYARTGGVHIAFQLFDGLGSSCRVLVFDQGGTGLSDPVDIRARTEHTHALNGHDHRRRFRWVRHGR